MDPFDGHNAGMNYNPQVLEWAERTYYLDTEESDDNDYVFFDWSA